MKSPAGQINALTKGERTRERILKAARKLLKSQSYGQLKITAIAAEARVAQPNFYAYFPSLDALLLELAEKATVDSLAPLLEKEWDGAAGLEHVREFVRAALILWDEHHAVFAVTNLIADEGNLDFARTRIQQMKAINSAIEAKVRTAQECGRLSKKIDARLVGYECVALIGTVGQRRGLFVDSGFDERTIIDTTARLLQMLTCGSTQT